MTNHESPIITQPNGKRNGNKNGDENGHQSPPKEGLEIEITLHQGHLYATEACQRYTRTRNYQHQAQTRAAH